MKHNPKLLSMEELRRVMHEDPSGDYDTLVRNFQVAIRMATHFPDLLDEIAALRTEVEQMTKERNDAVVDAAAWQSCSNAGDEVIGELRASLASVTKERDELKEERDLYKRIAPPHITYCVKAELDEPRRTPKEADRGPDNEK